MDYRVLYYSARKEARYFSGFPRFPDRLFFRGWVQSEQSGERNGTHDTDGYGPGGAGRLEKAGRASGDAPALGRGNPDPLRGAGVRKAAAAGGGSDPAGRGEPLRPARHGRGNRRLSPAVGLGGGDGAPGPQPELSCCRRDLPKDADLPAVLKRGTDRGRRRGLSAGQRLLPHRSAPPAAFHSAGLRPAAGMEPGEAGDSERRLLSDPAGLPQPGGPALGREPCSRGLPGPGLCGGGAARRRPLRSGCGRKRRSARADDRRPGAGRAGGARLRAAARLEAERGLFRCNGGLAARDGRPVAAALPERRPRCGSGSNLSDLPACGAECGGSPHPCRPAPARDRR